MKKNISINISGIIFHVEEDGYEKLKIYLESISRYFASYEDSKEIVDDIENRIAEVFLSKLSASKEVITLEDVEAVMATMGGIEDFAAAEELEDADADYRKEREYTGSSTYTDYETSEPKRLVRDTKRKIIGGVAAGLAHYFHTDPLWIRLILLALLFTDAFISAGTITFFTYIICWIVIPGRDDIPGDEKIKKLYRNPDDRVLGGVSSGIAAYFGTDTTLIRILFVISIFFGGLGILAYIVLWIITPEANTLTEKMRMQGEPVTLANIESTVKKNLNVNENDEETPVVKVLLFPFRLIAQVFNGLARVTGPFLVFLAQVARIIAGLIVFFVGLALLFAIVVAAGVLLGIFTGDITNFHGEFPVMLIRNSLPGIGIIAALSVLGIPALFLLFAGVSLVINRKVVNAAFGWSALGIWFVAVAILSFTIPPVLMEFKEDATYTTSEDFDLGKNTAILTVTDSDTDMDYDLTDLRIRGTADSVYRLEKVFKARGSSRANAEENAQMVDYQVAQSDSTLTFPSDFSFKEGAQFRVQELDMTLYIPYGQTFTMDRSIRKILKNPIYSMGLTSSELRDNLFTVTVNGLECVTCEERPVSNNPAAKNYDGDALNFDLRNFDAIDIGDNFKINISQSDSFQVFVSGSQDLLNEVEANVKGSTLYLDLENSDILDKWNQRNLEVFIAMPKIDRLELHEGAEAIIENYEGDDVKIELTGAAKLDMNLVAGKASVDLSGASHLTLTGSLNELEADLSGASRLQSDECQTAMVTIECSGVSKSKVRADQEINAEVSPAASLTYTGNGELRTENRRKNNIQKF